MWLRDYFSTYVERDVRSLRNVTDLEAFSAFVRMAVGRTKVERRVVYGGDLRQSRSGTEVVPWNRLPEMDWS